MQSESLKDFFNNRNLIYIIDMMASRYGLTPAEVMTRQTIFEFCLNSAIMIIADLENRKSHIQPSDWSKLGIKRSVVTRGK